MSFLLFFPRQEWASILCTLRHGHTDIMRIDVINIILNSFLSIERTKLPMLILTKEIRSLFISCAEDLSLSQTLLAAAYSAGWWRGPTLWPWLQPVEALPLPPSPLIQSRAPYPIRLCSKDLVSHFVPPSSEQHSPAPPVATAWDGKNAVGRRRSAQ
jgi:hypothetical protein